MAESGGVVVQRAVASFSEAWGFCRCSGVRVSTASFSGGVQLASCPSVSLDVQRSAIGAWDAVRPDAPAATAGASMGEPPAFVLGTFAVPASALQASSCLTGGKLVKRSSSYESFKPQKGSPMRSMSWIVALAAGFGFALLVCHTYAAGEQQEISEREQKWAEAVQRNDVDAIGSFLSSDFTVNPRGQLLHRKE